jgi:predicted phage terminase large subunit-like protein
MTPAGTAWITSRKKWQSAPHLKLIDEHLLALARREITRLMISMPPRHGKSQLASYYFPAWWLGTFPDDQIVLTTYSDSFASLWGGRVRDLISEWGKPIWGIEVDNSTHAKNEWTLKNHQGGMVTAGMGGSLTGRGFHLGIVDDPIRNADIANSPTYQEKMLDWWDSTFASRGEPGNVIVLMMTRWSCLLPGCGIMTDMGIANIETIMSGQTVLTSAGAQVVEAAAARPYNGEVVSIRVSGYPAPLRVTPEHRILTEHGWREAGSLCPGDWVSYPVPQGPDTSPDTLRKLIPAPPAPHAKRDWGLTGAKGRVPREELAALLKQGKTYQQIAEHYGYKSRQAIMGYATAYGLNPPAGNVLTGDPTSDPDFWRVVGYWLAEGYITSGHSGKIENVVRWAFGWDEQHLVADVAEVLGRYGLTVGSWKPSNPGSFPTKRITSFIVAHCSSRQLAEFLALFGRGAEKKMVPEWAVFLPERCAQELIKGYWLGDGCSWSNGPSNGQADWGRITSVSLSLLSGMQRLLLRLGITSSIMKGQGRSYELRFALAETPWMGKENAKPAWHTSMRLEKDRLLLRVRAIELEEYHGPVYDLQTPCHDFVSNNVTVHNCNDIAGKLLERMADGGEKWTVLNLPALAEENDPLGRPVGKALWPARWPTRILEEIRRNRKPYWWAAMYQQRPAPAEGGRFKKAWFLHYRVLDDGKVYELHTRDGQKKLVPAAKCKRFATMDLATSLKQDSDYTVIAIWAQTPDNELILLDVIREHVEGPDHLNLVWQAHHRYKLHFIAIEQVGFQLSAVQAARRKGLPVRGFEVDGDKGNRALSISARYQSGDVYHPTWAVWLPAWETELLTFPNAAKDDQVDTASMAGIIISQPQDAALEHVKKRLEARKRAEEQERQQQEQDWY